MASARAVHDREADRVLAGRCAAGDREAQRQLFHEQQKRVHVVLYRIMGTNRDMEDLVQDAFLEIFRSLGGFRGEASLATWVDRVTVRVAYRWLSRRPAPVARLEAVRDLPADVPAPERALAARNAARRLFAVLDRLEPMYRIAYALSEIDGRSAREVAELTGVSVVAAKNRIWRARRRVNEAARRDPLLQAFLDGSAEGSEQ
jgi:RNA polymerase sigma-70 factor (ECF subfamily)